MKIEVGKTYESAWDGVRMSPVKIVYRLEGRTIPLFTGVHINSSGEAPSSSIFLEDGTICGTPGYTLLDPKTLPEIPWDQVPPWLNWWSMDIDGAQYYYRDKPRYDVDRWVLTTTSRVSGLWKIPEEHRFLYMGRPEDSLRKRLETCGKKG